MTRRDKVRAPVGERKNVTMMIDHQIIRRNEIAWAIAYGEFPPRRIYHLDGDPMNFRLSNLTLNRPRKAANPESQAEAPQHHQ